MSENFHGVRAEQNPTPVSTPTTAASAIVFAVGTAPVHATGKNNNVNRAVRAGNNAEAVSTLGYSDSADGWKKYDLCEVMFSQFRLYRTAPVFFVNVLDPERHKKTTPAKAYPVVDRRVVLPFEAIKASVKAQDYKAGEDFELFYNDDALVLEILDGGSILQNITELTVGFDEVDPSKVTKADIIGGYNVATKQKTGLELIDTVFPAFGVVPDLIIAPGWSHDAEVAAVMSAKAESINGLFSAKALIDVDTEKVRHYSEAPAWKKAQNIFDSTQVLCFPMVKLGEKVFHLSTQMAGVMAATDRKNNGVPSESPSNNSLQCGSAVLADGTEILLDAQEANFLNENGIVTAINKMGGFVLWGNYTACYPVNKDPKDFFIPVSRMFGWRGNSAILTFWERVDEKMTYRFASSIIDSINIQTNGLVKEGHLLGGRVELPAELNDEMSLSSGKIKIRITQTPPPPAQDITFLLEYDLSYLSAIFG